MRSDYTPFSSLTRRGQLSRLRQLAQSALQEYDLRDPHVELIQYWLNATFLVEAARPGSHASDRYVLRVQAPGLQNEKLIWSEMVWLRAIRDDTGLAVPEPVPTSSGELLTTVSAPGVPEPRHCVLFRWVPGRFFRRGLTPNMLEKVGVFMATLHTHAQHFKPPDGFTRKRWDLRGLLGDVVGTDLHKSLSRLSPEGRRVAESMIPLAGGTLEKLNEERDLFGMIHADLHRGNIIFYQGLVGAIDFEVSGWGYFPYDIGVTFSVLRDYPDFDGLRAGFFRGYRRVRPLSAEHEALVDILRAARLLGHSLWLAALSEKPAVGPRMLVRAESQLDYLRRFMEQ
ncbi:MAG TPA: phosphotransferase [Chloroflexia bacterium]|nr:phosphotransferase [Chloroflexia bacterium]